MLPIQTGKLPITWMSNELLSAAILELVCIKKTSLIVTRREENMEK